MLKTLSTLILTITLTSLAACGGGGGGGSAPAPVAQPEPPAPAPTPTPPQGTAIDVLVVFGQEVNEFGNFEERVLHQLFVTETAFYEAGLDVDFNIVHTVQTQYPRTFTAIEALEDITLNQHPAFNNIHRLRDQYRADIVILYRKFANDGTCGRAYIGGQDGDFTGYDDFAYALVASGCPDTVSGHEIGHLFGLVHDRRSTTNTPAFPYGRGYGVDQEFVTMMGVSGSYGFSARIATYSSPRTTCVGQPCGIEDEADAARALGNALNAISNYR